VGAPGEPVFANAPTGRGFPLVLHGIINFPSGGIGGTTGIACAATFHQQHCARLWQCEGSTMDDRAARDRAHPHAHRALLRSVEHPPQSGRQSVERERFHDKLDVRIQPSVMHDRVSGVTAGEQHFQSRPSP
jgi:hypothetical protein